MSVDFHIFVLHNGIYDTIKELDKQCEIALKSVGSTAVNYAKQDCPVDTGRLRHSRTYATEESQGGQNQSGGQAATVPGQSGKLPLRFRRCNGRRSDSCALSA